MRFNNLFFVLFFICFYSAYSQVAKVHLSKDGKVLQQFLDYSIESKNTDVFFKIENLDEKEYGNYKLLFYWSKDQNFETNGFFPKNTYDVLHYANIDDDLNHFRVNENKNMQFLNYQLVYVNDYGKELLKQKTTINLDNLNKSYESALYEIIKVNDLTALISIQKKADEIELNIKNNNKELEIISKSETATHKEIEKRKVEIVRNEKTIEKLSSATHSGKITEYLNTLSSETKKLELENFYLKKDIDTYKISLDKKIAKSKDTLKFIKKLMIELAFKEKAGVLKEPPYKILHQGVVINPTLSNLAEIVYDVTVNSNINNNRDLELGRLTTDMPIMTTNTELFAHIVNLKKVDLVKNKFFIQMGATTRDSVFIESPSNLKNIDDFDFNFEGLFKNMTANIGADESIKADGGTKSNPPFLFTQKNDTILKIINLIKPKVNTEANYTEYMLKYPKTFEANTATTINLSSKQLIIEGYEQKVEGGKKKKPNYTVKYASKLLASDELTPTSRLYRFAVSAGVMYANEFLYTYDANNIETKVNNFTLKPSITFSTYILPQNLDYNQPNWLKTTHIDFSLDYVGDDFLDTVYLGFGIEPVRNLNVGVGYRMGKTDRLVDGEYTRASNNGLYANISLGFNLIPSVIKYIF